MSDINVEVVFALPERQYVKVLAVPEGTTVGQAIQASGILEARKELDLAVNKVGVFSRAAKLTDVLQDGDRVEIYRPLTADPKELRRIRVEKSKKKTL
ncbi:RnfH family protein [Budvicia diplopodorum]|uniref:RnfH family protein n=1 Tax=Budvicia diplopodorum TaxID=1119056 RepID=UPI001357EEBC|nr:RnfH family protein [Budvicia diplopodorum]